LARAERFARVFAYAFDAASGARRTHCPSALGSRGADAEQRAHGIKRITSVRLYLFGRQRAEVGGGSSAANPAT